MREDVQDERGIKQRRGRKWPFGGLAVKPSLRQGEEKIEAHSLWSRSDEREGVRTSAR